MQHVVLNNTDVCKVRKEIPLVVFIAVEPRQIITNTVFLSAISVFEQEFFAIAGWLSLNLVDNAAKDAASSAEQTVEVPATAAHAEQTVPRMYVTEWFISYVRTSGAELIPTADASGISAAVDFMLNSEAGPTRDICHVRLHESELTQLYTLYCSDSSNRVDALSYEAFRGVFEEDPRLAHISWHANVYLLAYAAMRLDAVFS